MTRQDPRWIESTFYNANNLILCLILLFTVIRYRKNLKRRKTITNGRFFVDDLDLTDFLGPGKTSLLIKFITAPEKTLTCFEITGFLVDLELEDAGSETECKKCFNTNQKVSRCNRYRRIYRNILDLKKLMEMLEVATFEYPENKMKILKDGWQFRPYTNVDYKN